MMNGEGGREGGRRSVDEAEKEKGEATGHEARGTRHGAGRVDDTY